MLQELRSGSGEYSSSRGTSPAAGRLAEMRARQALRRRSSQAHDLTSLSARLSQSSFGPVNLDDADGNPDIVHDLTPDLPEEEAIDLTKQETETETEGTSDDDSDEEEDVKMFQKN